MSNIEIGTEIYFRERSTGLKVGSGKVNAIRTKTTSQGESREYMTVYGNTWIDEGETYTDEEEFGQSLCDELNLALFHIGVECTIRIDNLKESSLT